MVQLYNNHIGGDDRTNQYISKCWTAIDEKSEILLLQLLSPMLQSIFFGSSIESVTVMIHYISLAFERLGAQIFDKIC